MFESVQCSENEGDTAVSVDIAPLVDLVFTLLIFFLLTASFTRDLGVDVKTPEAASGEAFAQESMRIVVVRSGAIYVEGERIGAEELLERIRRYTAANRKDQVVIVPDEDVPARDLVAVIDLARQGGAGAIILATRKPESSP